MHSQSDVITAQLCKKLIMQAEVKIAVISKGGSRQCRPVFQTPCKHQPHFTTPLCMQLVNNATHLKTQLQPYNDFAWKKERLTL